MKHFSLIVILVTLSASAPFSGGQTSTNKKPDSVNKSDAATQEIMQLESNLNEAVLKGDTVVLDTVIAEDWFAKNADTSVVTKPQLIAFIKSNGSSWASIKDENVNISFYDSAAVVNGLSTRRLKGSESPIHFRFTRVYAKPLTGWQLVAMHVERINQ